MAVPFEARRVSDGALLRLVKAMVAISPTAAADLTLLGGSTIELAGAMDLPEETREALSNSSFFITLLTIAIPDAGLNLEYRRGQVFRNRSGQWYWQPAEDTFIDGFAIEGPSRNNRDAVFRAISQTISLAPPGELKNGTAALEHADRMLLRITDAAAEVTEHTAQRQLDLDRLRIDLEQRAEKQTTTDRERLAREHAEAMAVLAEREKALTHRETQINNNSNTHVRRDLQQKMANLADTRLKEPLLSRSMVAFVMPAVVAFIALVGLGFLALSETAHLRLLDELLSGAAGANVSPRNAATIAVLSRSVLFEQVRLLLTTFFAGLLIWFTLRLATNRYRQVSRWEHELHKFQLDTERASFLIEGELEARRLDGQVLPQVVLDRFSRGLFAGGNEDSGAEGDAVGSVLGHLFSRAAKLKLGTDGMELELDKSSMKKARKDVAKDADRDD